MKKTRVLVTVAMLIAVDIILTRLLKIEITPTLRLTFGFIAIALIGIQFGPLIAGAAAAVSDVLGFLLLNTSAAPFFPGFTASALVMGVIYGVFLYKKRCNVLRIVLSAVLVIVLVELGMNTLWLSILYGKGFFVLVVPRLIKAAIMLPIQTGLIFVVWKTLSKAVPGFSTIEPSKNT